MRSIIRAGGVSIVMAVAFATAACQQAPTPAPEPTQPAPAPAAEPAPAAAADATPAAGAWPASLPAFGDGFPNPGDPCRRVGESAATANFLDHTASLVGCLSATDAAALGGRVVATVDGVTLVSVPNAASGAPAEAPR